MVSLHPFVRLKDKGMAQKPVSSRATDNPELHPYQPADGPGARRHLRSTNHDHRHRGSSRHSAIAANSFAITAESLCYMPGYGIADAATTLVGQSLGAGRHRLTRRFAYITVFMGMAVMGIMGVVMYIFAPQIIGTMTPVEEIRRLGVMALRIEAFAEPMFAAAIISYGVFVGAANTLVPSLMNFFSIWAVRISLAAWLAPTMGLKGVWVAMCAELCFRGIIFLIRLRGKRWMKI